MPSVARPKNRKVSKHTVVQRPTDRPSPHLSSLLPALPPFATMTAVSALMALSCPALAQSPTGGTVVGGSASISQTPSVTSINQSSNKAIINWQGFSVGANHTVNFNQPSSTAATLNRVIGNEASVISGALNANGRVFIVNSAGVLFGKGAQVNVGGLVASTLDIDNQDFMAGNYRFSGNSTASVVNRGRITASPGGYVALLGKTVSNQGVITARLGTVALSSGKKLTLNFEGDSLVDVTIDQGVLNALVENKRAIIADGGRVIMTARAADGLLSAQVNNTGIVQARSVAALKGGSVRIGTIKIHAYGGKAKVAGKLDASAPQGGNGGFIETSGDEVQVADGAVITTAAANGKAGTWLIDPTDFNIVDGSGAQTTSGIGAQTLAANLANGNVTIVTAATGSEAGNINVNAAVSWAADTILTLNAINNININAPITASGTNAGLVLNYGNYATTGTVAAGTNYVVNAPVTLAGSNATLAINGNSYTLIRSLSDLAAFSDVAGFYALANDIDAGGTTYTGAVMPTLSGTLAGLGHTIDNLTIASTDFFVGLIGGTEANSNSVIRDLKLTNVDITGDSLTGALIGLSQATTVISNVSATGSVTGAQSVGGLIGTAVNTAITNVTADVAVAGRTAVGGLVGTLQTNSVVRNSFAHGTVTGARPSAGPDSSNIGGFAGVMSSGAIIQDSGATGAVITTDSLNVGGLVGNLSSANIPADAPISVIINSFASGPVTATCAVSACAPAGATGGTRVGGLVGVNSGGNITASEATGNVTVTAGGSATVAMVGGLVGYNTTAGATLRGGIISDSRASGNVTGVGNVIDLGGLAGRNASGQILNSSASGNVTGHRQLGGLVGANSGNPNFPNAGTISGSTASGNVSWNGFGDAPASGSTLGGLAGLNGAFGKIVDSIATGHVNGLHTVGGLVGNNQSGSITGSEAHGSVTGTGVNPNSGLANVGGLVGFNGTVFSCVGGCPLGTITNSLATGAVSGIGPAVGGLVGANGVSAESAGIVRDSSWNRTINPRVNGIGTSFGIEINLTGTLSPTTPESAGAQSSAATNMERALASPPDGSQSAAGTAATTSPETQAVDGSVAAIEGAVRSEDEQRTRRRRAAAAAKQQRPAGKDGGSGPTIRSIEVEGQRFDLQKGQPGQKPKQ